MTALATDPCLRMSRWLAAPCEQVFEALVEPAWMRGWMLSDAEAAIDIDLRVGGEWSITNRRNGRDFVAQGRYVEIDRPRHLVYTISKPQISANCEIVAIGLEPEAGGCLLTLTQSGVDTGHELARVEHGDKSNSESRWTQRFDALGKFLGVMAQRA